MGTLETREGARFLHIGTDGGGFVALPLVDQTVEKLVARGIVYDCGAGHDLHLTPDHEWDVDDVEAISIAIFEARAPGDLKKIVVGLRLQTIRAANLSRCMRWHPGGVDDWSPERWFTATAGELGEAGNALKKLFRVEDGIANVNAPDRDIQSRAQATETIADELADTFIYLDLLAARLGINLEEAVRRVFNRTSHKYDFPERLGEYSAFLIQPPKESA